MRNGAAYVVNIPECINFVPNNIILISGPKAMNIHENIRAKTEKYL